MNNTPASNNLQLELHVPNFAQVKEYYGAMGFKIVWEREPDGVKGYLVMSLEDTTICFWAGTDAVYEQPYFKRFPRDTPRGYGVELVIMVDDIETIMRVLKT
jgi:hypothetical protein